MEEFWQWDTCGYLIVVSLWVIAFSKHVFSPNIVRYTERRYGSGVA